ncbi:hypothetical protein QN277_018670 [Acacia crassicarpa]|uniref:Uncharacterized protein n=1 Tax=Acacia crassicarpa TaxID=499986 RepID=A0AAE1JX24_9FABA|nr:hypothetical protein QN277_018670 [Acacia crassicarpa]
MLNFLFARLSLLPTCKRRHHLGFLLSNASHIFNSFSSVVDSSESALSKRNQEEQEASKGIKLKDLDLDKADSICNIFRSYGFSETQISKAVRTCPQLLRMSPEILLPKLRFLDSFGFSRSELPEILSSSSMILRWNLEKCLIPRVEALKSVVGNDYERLSLALRRSGWIFLQQDVTNVAPNMKVLREHGVPQSSITQLITNHAGLAFIEPAKFAEHVKFSMEIGIEPVKLTLIKALYVLAATRKSTWKSKLDAFERWGWSKDMTHSVFRKFPYCMTLSENKIANSMKFLVDEMSLTFEDIETCPVLLGYSLKQRVAPRWSVVKTLKMKGLFTKKVAPRSIFGLSEKEFLEKYVSRFQESCPQLLSIYKDSKASVPEVH